MLSLSSLLRVYLPNNRSAFHHGDFVSSAFSDLVNLGLIVELFLPPTVINPLSVSVNSEGKARLILDLRHVNKNIPKAKFRMEDWKVFSSICFAWGIHV